MTDFMCGGCKEPLPGCTCDQQRSNEMSTPRKASKSEMQLLGARLAFYTICLVFGVIIVLAFFPPAAQASEQPRVVNEMTSTPGESKEAFVGRVAVFLNGWTFYNGSEACGMIATRDDTYSIVVTTLDSQIMCDSVMVLVGYASTGETIHSHPRPNAAGKIKLTDRTRELATGSVKRLTFITPVRQQFSPGDFAAGPGYLVTDDLLLYQRGRGTREVIQRLHTPEAVAVVP